MSVCSKYPPFHTIGWFAIIQKCWSWGTSLFTQKYQQKFKPQEKSPHFTKKSCIHEIMKLSMCADNRTNIFKSRIGETLNLLTNAVSITIAIKRRKKLTRGIKKTTQKKKFKSKKNLKGVQKNLFSEGIHIFILTFLCLFCYLFFCGTKKDWRGSSTFLLQGGPHLFCFFLQ